jgi:hypothetical protein
MEHAKRVHEILSSGVVQGIMHNKMNIGSLCDQAWKGELFLFCLFAPKPDEDCINNIASRKKYAREVIQAFEDCLSPECALSQKEKNNVQLLMSIVIQDPSHFGTMLAFDGWFREGVTHLLNDINAQIRAGNHPE